MRLSERSWRSYIDRLRTINDRAADAMTAWMRKNPAASTEELIEYAYAIATRYGEAAASLACEMYDRTAAAQGALVPPAEPAATATYGETARAVRGTAKVSEIEIPQEVGRLVKLAGVDTTMQNAIRDGAEWAWIPHGDTCAFCITLASNGWQRASKAAMKGGHAEHIHANCDCTYAVRFDGKSTVAGYRPKEYLAMYENAPLDKWNTPDGKPPAGHEGAEKRTPQNLINAMRRQAYAQNAEEINAQKRSAYAVRKERESSAAEEIEV